MTSVDISLIILFKASIIDYLLEYIKEHTCTIIEYSTPFTADIFSNSLVLTLLF